MVLILLVPKLRSYANISMCFLFVVIPVFTSWNTSERRLRVAGKEMRALQWSGVETAVWKTAVSKAKA